MKIHSMLAAAMFALGLAPMSKADIVFNNFDASNGFSDSGRALQGETYGTVGKIDQAQQFTVGSSSYYLTSVSIGAWPVDSPSPGTGPLDLWVTSDASGIPGATLAAATLNVSTTGKQILTASYGGTLVLEANTTYWVVANARGNIEAGWDETNLGLKGTTAGRFNNGAWSSRLNDDQLSLKVQGRPAPVPEPGTIAFLSVSGLAVLRRRRN